MTHSDSPAWRLVRAAAAAARGRGLRLEDGGRYALEGDTLVPVAPAEGAGALVWHSGWQSLLSAQDDPQGLLDRYLPLAGAHQGAPWVIGQLGQSLDGYIATASGQSHFVTGEASILHLHRLRALSDCVIVGAGTVAADDPRLTTRLVSGANPARVVLDPQLRLPDTRHIFRDAQAPTLRVRARGVPLPATRVSATVEDIELPAAGAKLDLFALLAELRTRGHRMILVEGGGVTVSAFLAAGLLDCMHIVVAPFIMGEGRPGLRIASPARLQDCLRPHSRVHALGSDVLFELDLRKPTEAENDSGAIRQLLQARP